MGRKRPDLARLLQRAWRSLAFKFAVLIVAFAAVPVFLYVTFESADDERRRIVLQAMQEQTRTIASVLYPSLAALKGEKVAGLSERLTELAGERLRVKLLFRPASVSGSRNFFYVASTPTVSAEYLSIEREELIKSGLLERLDDSCEGNQPQGVRYVNPAGSEEILTAVIPLQAANGCWVLLTSRSLADLKEAALWRPYWQGPEVRLAAAIYVILALVVFSLFFDVWRNLRRFGRLARELRTVRKEGLSFAEQNQIPELEDVAEELDRMVRSLLTSARWIRFMAEDNAHALKTPIAIISQSLEPLRRIVRGNDPRGERAVEIIETSVAKLDRLVSQARQLEETAAELLEAPRNVIDLSRLTSGVAEGFRDAASAAGVEIVIAVEPGLRVLATDDLVETVIENLIENALSFSASGGKVFVSLGRRQGTAVLEVADEGPGVAAAALARVFERYYSQRPAEPASDAGTPGDAAEQHFGIGLWIARRNVEALGGSIAAANRPEGGLVMRVVLPLHG